MARDIHVTVESKHIANFMELDKSRHICFRCGEVGHVRSQCMHFKIRLCWHFANGRCTAPSDKHCPFAHGEEDLRFPWRLRCIRVVRQEGGDFVCVGCNSTTHTFRKCPHSKTLLLL
jgi:hypothetical protein